MINPFILRAGESGHRLLRRRRGRERAFLCCGVAAIAVSLLFLGFFLATVLRTGIPAFTHTHIRLPVTFSAEVLEGYPQDPDAMRRADYPALIRRALEVKFPEVTGRGERMQLYRLVSKSAAQALRDFVLEDAADLASSRELRGQTHDLWLPASADVNLLMKRRARTLESQILSPEQIAWADRLAETGAVRTQFHWRFLTAADSREPEMAGILGSATGSLYVILVCLLVAFPLGVGAAVYQEEFMPRGRWADFIEVSVNNLAAVPSIVYGLLALAVFLNLSGLPRGSSLAGGLALAMLVLPTLIITTRHAIAAVPPSIRAAAAALGATPLQTLFHHTLPLAMPGVMTGTILGIARALGETAPLLMIGMVAFVADLPRGMTDQATTLPVQIYLWADSPEPGFLEKTSGAVLVLLALLAALNLGAVYLRRKFQYKW